MRTVLTIAGSDPSGGAGIQADLKTFAAHRVYGTAVMTALTAQNTQGVQGVLGIEPEFVRAQLVSIFSDLRVDAVKLGMLFSREIMEVVAEVLEQHARCPIVLDPVMVATSGDRLLRQEAEAFMRERMLPLATLCTPNLAEAEVLAGHSITSREAALEAAVHLALQSGTAILLKGGHPTDDEDRHLALDLLQVPNGEGTTFSLPRIDTPHTHGTGCTLSSAIACRLAEGHSLEDSCRLAKEYLHRALAAGRYLGIGRGRGPVWHGV